jgi:hypothetical protein
MVYAFLPISLCRVGGSHKTKIMTAYKENCIQIVRCLEKHGPLTPSSLRKMGTGDKTLAILNRNYYGWFERIKRGTYAISDIGRTELATFPELIQYYTELEKTVLFSRV